MWCTCKHTTQSITVTLCCAVCSIISIQHLHASYTPLVPGKRNCARAQVATIGRKHLQYHPVPVSIPSLVGVTTMDHGKRPAYRACLKKVHRKVRVCVNQEGVPSDPTSLPNRSFATPLNREEPERALTVHACKWGNRNQIVTGLCKYLIY